MTIYDNFFTVADFNSEDTEPLIRDFREMYHVQPIMKSPICFKNQESHILI